MSTFFVDFEYDGLYYSGEAVTYGPVSFGEARAYTYYASSFWGGQCIGEIDVAVAEAISLSSNLPTAFSQYSQLCSES